MSSETVTFNLELNVENAIDNTRQLEMVVYRSLSLYNRWCDILGVPKDSPMSTIMMRAQQFVMLVRLLSTSLSMLEAPSSPLGVVKAILGLASTGTAAITMTQQFQSSQW